MLLEKFRLDGKVAVVTTPPNINLAPYREWISKPFRPMIPIPVASPILI